MTRIPQVTILASSMVRLTPEGKLHIDIGLRTQTYNHEATVLSPNDPNRKLIVDEFNTRLRDRGVENLSIDNDGPVIILEPKSDDETDHLLSYLGKVSLGNHLIETAPIGKHDKRIAVVFVKRNLDTLNDERRIERLKEFESVMDCYRHEQLLANGGRLS